MLKYLIATILAVTTITTFAAAFEADRVLAQGGAKLELSNSLPCVVKAVVDQNTPEIVAKSKAARVTLGDKILAACWLEDSHGQVWFMDEDGDIGGPIDVTAFKKIVKG